MTRHDVDIMLLYHPFTFTYALPTLLPYALHTHFHAPAHLPRPPATPSAVPYIALSLSLHHIHRAVGGRYALHAAFTGTFGGLKILPFKHALPSPLHLADPLWWTFAGHL